MAAPSFVLTDLGAIRTADQSLYYGTGSIAGTIKVLSTPAARRVVLMHEASMRLVRETVSGVDGSYRFDNIDETQRYSVITFDNEPGGYNAAIASYQPAV